MSLNSFITLGRSGLRVSPLCLGSMTFGEDLGWGASVTDSETMIAAYLERGGNFIDTANVYPNIDATTARVSLKHIIHLMKRRLKVALRHRRRRFAKDRFARRVQLVSATH
jgi:aryl-alcohol dehydrogenase-like predicted oxidoreductase